MVTDERIVRLREKWARGEASGEEIREVRAWLERKPKLTLEDCKRALFVVSGLVLALAAICWLGSIIAGM